MDQRFLHGELGPRKTQPLSNKQRRQKEQRNNNRIILDNNDNNVPLRTPRTSKKRRRPRKHAVPSTFFKRKDYIQYFLKNDLTGKHLPAFMRHQINQVKEALKDVRSMRNNTIFTNYCNDNCSLIDMVKLFYQIFGESGDVVKEYARLTEKRIDMPSTDIISYVGSIYIQCEQGKLQLRQSKEVDSDGDFLMAEPKKLTQEEVKKQKNEKRQLTRQENVIIDKTKGRHKCFAFSETSSGCKCCCGKDFVFRQRKKKRS